MSRNFNYVICSEGQILRPSSGPEKMSYHGCPDPYCTSSTYDHPIYGYGRNHHKSSDFHERGGGYPRERLSDHAHHSIRPGPRRPTGYGISMMCDSTGCDERYPSTWYEYPLIHSGKCSSSHLVIILPTLPTRAQDQALLGQGMAVTDLEAMVEYMARASIAPGDSNVTTTVPAVI